MLYPGGRHLARAPTSSETTRDYRARRRGGARASLGRGPEIPLRGATALWGTGRADITTGAIWGAARAGATIGTASPSLGSRNPGTGGPRARVARGVAPTRAPVFWKREQPHIFFCIMERNFFFIQECSGLKSAQASRVLGLLSMYSLRRMLGRRIQCKKLETRGSRGHIVTDPAGDHKPGARFKRVELVHHRGVSDA